MSLCLLLIGTMYLVTQLCLTLCDPMDCNRPGSSVYGDPPEEYWSGLPCPPPGNLLNPGIEHRLPYCRRIFHPPSEPLGKPDRNYW